MSKKLSLNAALKNAANKTQPNKVVKEEKQIKTVIPPSRIGKKAITGFFEPEVSKQLKTIALDNDATVQELLNEALNDLFLKKGKSAII